MGRPSKKNDVDQLESLMRLKPTLADTAAFFKCTERTIERYIRDNFDKTFFDFRHENMVHTRLSLVREAIKQAQSGNTAMLIFCLKNLCGWTDRVEVGTEPIQTFNLKYQVVKKEKEVIDVGPGEEIKQETETDDGTKP
jgi:AraC-like DNA-binding protein